MWEQWKKKIKALFAEEEVNEQQEKTQQKHTPDPQAKMMYQYPNKPAFRFPLIPDEQSESNQAPKSNNRPNKSYVAQPERKRRKDEADKDQGRKVYKKDTDIPFKRTEVPSPIYGFQQRKKNKILDDIPAYKRKEERIAEAWAAMNVEKEFVDHAENTAPILPATEWPVDEAASTNEEFSDVQVKEAIEPVTQSLAKTESDPLEESEEKSENLSKREEAKPRSLSSTGAGNKTTSKGPFNVIMTPRDKKQLYDKQRRQQEQLQKSYTSKAESPSQTIATEEVTPQQASIPIHLLNDPVQKNNADHEWITEQQELLERTLKHFNVRARVVNATQGPSVTRFEVQPELGVKVSKVKNLSDDLKLNMAAKDIRIEAPIPGKNTIGIEIPNPNPQMVGLQGLFESEAFATSMSPLTIALGLSIEGRPLITNIQKMPHGLIAGATGSGKSVCINTILLSMLYKASHEDVKFLLIDPKMVELAPYNGIPHLVSPVITDVKAATAALKWAVAEMESRYERFVQEGVRDLERYNQKVLKQGRLAEKMPYIVIVIDELADLMMMSPHDVEEAISRIAQKARACGIHLLLATQRPSVDVITGLIKANIPTRIAFSVSSQVDSRTILDTAGADKLLGKGDMLFIENGAGKSIRLQGPFVSDEEIERVTSYARSLAEPHYMFEQEQLLEQVATDEAEDELMEEAINFILIQNSASTSLLQRHFKIGYNRAARLIDALEMKGIVSGQNGSKPREVLATRAQIEEMQLND
ncbi:DNA translocase FtsK [Oceanobacillus kapialis]|uniref:DNA translocase FtsK n=1 Tax=Oceanobacillus kapialis TaxID=481353 RepID=A0ABW5Q4M8_9BACI